MKQHFGSFVNSSFDSNDTKECSSNNLKYPMIPGGAIWEEMHFYYYCRCCTKFLFIATSALWFDGKSSSFHIEDSLQDCADDCTQLCVEAEHDFIIPRSYPAVIDHIDSSPLPLFYIIEALRSAISSCLVTFFSYHLTREEKNNFLMPWKMQQFFFDFSCLGPEMEFSNACLKTLLVI